MRRIQKEPATGLMVLLGLFFLLYYIPHYTIQHINWSTHPWVEATVLSSTIDARVDRRTRSSFPRTVYYYTYRVEYQWEGKTRTTTTTETKQYAARGEIMEILLTKTNPLEFFRFYQSFSVLELLGAGDMGAFFLWFPLSTVPREKKTNGKHR